MMSQRPRAEERRLLHGLWPSDAEVLQAECPDLTIWRETHPDGAHGDWCARAEGENTPAIRAATVDGLRALIKIPGNNDE